MNEVVLDRCYHTGCEKKIHIICFWMIVLHRLHLLNHCEDKLQEIRGERAVKNNYFYFVSYLFLSKITY